MGRFRYIPSGTRFNRLVVLHRTANAGKDSRYLCRCDCGAEVSIRTTALPRKKSCPRCSNLAHLKKVHAKNCRAPGASTWTSVFFANKAGALRRNRTFALTEAEFVALCSQDCAYCGMPPLRETVQNHRHGSIHSNGVDRVDSTKGYTLGNCVTACWKCNLAKGTLSVEEFKSWVFKIYRKHHG